MRDHAHAHAQHDDGVGKSPQHSLGTHASGMLAGLEIARSTRDACVPEASTHFRTRLADRFASANVDVLLPGVSLLTAENLQDARILNLVTP